MVLLSLFRHSLYQRHIASNFFFCFILVLIPKLFFVPIVCYPDKILNYEPREVTANCFAQSDNSDLSIKEIKFLYQEHYDFLWLIFLVIAIVFYLLNNQFNSDQSDYMTLKVYYYLFKCILVLAFVISYFNYKLKTKFIDLVFEWVFGKEQNPLFKRQFICDLKRDIPEAPHLRSGTTTCKLRLNDIYEYIYIWVWFLCLFAVIINLICLIQVILLTLFRRYRVYRLKVLLPFIGKVNLNQLADNLDYFFVIECNSFKSVDRRRILKNSLVNQKEKKSNNLECSKNVNDLKDVNKNLITSKSLEDVRVEGEEIRKASSVQLEPLDI